MDAPNDKEKQQLIFDQAKRMNIWTETHEGWMKTVGPEVLCKILEELIAIQSKIDTMEKQMNSMKTKMNSMETKMNSMETEHRNLVNGSMKETYMRDGRFHLPPIETNSYVKPSTDSRNKQGTSNEEPNKNQDATTAKLNIPKARIVSPKSNIWLDVNEVKIPIKDDSGALLLSYMAGPPGKLPYINEFDVQSHVMILLKDAIRALGLEDYVQAHLEIALYTLRPDLVIVVRREGRMIFTVEVKSPGIGDEVFESKATSGQLWSYLLANKQLGNDVPTGALMTYDKMVLATLDDCGNSKGHKELLQHTRDTLKSGIQPRRSCPSHKEEQECHERQESPIRVQKKIRETTHALAARAENEDEEIEMECNIFYSRVFSKGEVFPALLQALEMAYHRCQRVNIQAELPVVYPGDNLGRRLFFKVGSDGYTFVLMPTHFCVNNGELPAHHTKHFYLLSKTGEGRSGAVYIACNNSGRLCAIKVYHIEKSSAATQEVREEEERKAMIACSKGIAKKEEELWKKLYGKRYKGVRQLQLGGRPCLLMPYGIEIYSEENRRKYLPAVKDELERIASMGFCYKGSDIRWRHVLLDPGNSNVFLSDLESMDRFSGVETKIVVRDQMEVLERTCSYRYGVDRANGVPLKRKVEEVAVEEERGGPGKKK